MRTQIMKLNYYGDHYTIVKVDEEYWLRCSWTEMDANRYPKRKSKTIYKRNKIHDCLAVLLNRTYS